MTASRCSVFTLGFVAALAAGQGAFDAIPVVLSTGNGTLIVRSALEKPRIRQDFEAEKIDFGIKGRPAVVQSPAMGATLTATEITGSAGPGKPEGYRLTASHATGGSRLLIISEEAAAFRATHHIKSEPAEFAESTQLDSESLDYLLAADIGVFSAPTHLVISDDRDGDALDKDKKPYHFHNTLHADGSSGSLTVDTDPKLPKPDLRAADIAGPVTFHLTSVRRTKGALTDITDIVDGTCDHLTLDRSTVPGILKASGHVHVVLSGRQVATMDSDEVTVSLDAAGKPLILESTPASIKAKTTEGGP